MYVGSKQAEIDALVLELSAVELIAEHTGRVEWLSVPKNLWADSIEKAQARRDHEEALYYAEFGILT